jgi:TIR domain-containing protein
VAVLFISHSSKDDPATVALEAWLRVNGFTDFFVDHQNIAGGAKWREELRASAGACRVVICLITENRLASNECYNEPIRARPFAARDAWELRTAGQITESFCQVPTPARFCLLNRFRNPAGTGHRNGSSPRIKPPTPPMLFLVAGSGPRPCAKAISSVRRPCRSPGRP